VNFKDGLRPGIQGRNELVIDDRHVTTHVGGRGVFSTPSMIGLMEITAHDSVVPLLGEGQTTVGYEVCVRHLARADPGERIVVGSTLTEVTGNKLLFEVTCHRGDTLLGTGTHRRAIVPSIT
jgi:fluoroacetyl-CoA thioesterase